jgi:hypothetical protein
MFGYRRAPLRMVMLQLGCHFSCLSGTCHSCVQPAGDLKRPCTQRRECFVCSRLRQHPGSDTAAAEAGLIDNHV